MPDSEIREFVVTSDGMGYEGFNGSTLTIYARTAVDSNARPPVVETSGGTRSAGPVIGAGAVQASGRIISNLEYNQDAVLVASVTLIDRDKIRDLLKQNGINFVGWNWSAYRF